MNKFQRLFQVAVNAFWEYKPIWTPRRLTTSVEEIKIDRPIFILGVQGGGLTLLTRMIHRNPEVVTIGGGRAFWVGNNEMDKQYIGELPEDFTLGSPGYRSPTFKTHIRGDEYRHPVFGLERDWVYACDDLLSHYRKTESDWTLEKERRLKQAVKEAIRAYAQAPREARFVDMSQTFSLKVPLLRKIFPDARFVLQARNPYATCVKEARSERYLWRRKLCMEEKLNIFSEHWKNTYQYALEDLKDYKHKVLVRYEDLVDDPEGTLQKVTAAIEINYHADMVPQAHHRLPVGSSESHKWYPVRTGANVKYLENIDSALTQIICANVEPLAKRFGYPLPIQ